MFPIAQFQCVGLLQNFLEKSYYHFSCIQLHRLNQETHYNYLYTVLPTRLSPTMVHITSLSRLNASSNNIQFNELHP